MHDKKIYTIGHSTHTEEEFLAMLQSFEVKLLVDVRRFPGSRKYPQFNAENLKMSLANVGIDYLQMEALGGRRRINPDSKNTRWNNPSFRAYADYMETDEFKNAVEELEVLAYGRNVVYMCSEAVWWRCHRALISDYLKAKGREVLHIMSVSHATEHSFTKPAIVKGGKISYKE